MGSFFYYAHKIFGKTSLYYPLIDTGLCAHQVVRNVIFRKFLRIYIYIWTILRSNCRNLTWVGFEPTTTEFRSDALTDRIIRSWVQLALRANIIELLQFHLLFSVRFHFSYCLRQLLRLFNQSFVEVITWV